MHFTYNKKIKTNDANQTNVTHHPKNTIMNSIYLKKTTQPVNIIVPQQIIPPIEKIVPQQIKPPDKIIVPQQIKPPDKIIVPQQIKPPDKIIVPKKITPPVEKESINNKESFRELCSNYTTYIQNIELPLIQQNNIYEAVFIEFRILPNIEFLIRNTILKLGDKWSHTFVCGNLNYDYILKLCNTIHKNIKVIHLEYDNLNPSTYSILLASVSFWNLFTGNKILIYQEDSIIFRSNIEDFLHYDYVGAPWDKSQNDTPNCVGNGGLSLRTKQTMIDVINKQNIVNININSSTKDYMKNAKLIICPEDVYFSKTMQDYNIGKVADWNTAYNFSTESILNNRSFGGHNFWLCDPNWKDRLFKHNIIQFNIPQIIEDDGFNEHRGGWGHIKETLNINKLYNTNNNYIFYDMLDIQFLFNTGHTIKQTWCGIFHCTPITPHYLTFINIKNIFNNKKFIESLKTCVGIITLSSYLTDYFKSALNDINVKVNVYTLKHPCITNVPLFNYDDYKYNSNKNIIQLGQQLRKLSSIYILPDIPNFSKMWLTGTMQFDKLNTFLNEEIELFNLDNSVIDINKIPMTYTKDFGKYDKLLTNNLVFMDLYDAAANNAIVECIVRNTPIIVNKLPGVVDYLGETYPLYFNNLNEIPDLLTENNILNAHLYLLNMNKEELEISYFNKKLFTLLYNIFSNL
jgi:hypothetical protein